jgi:hypothetical protein
MKVQMESTDLIGEVNGVPARIWEGVTESGVPFMAFVTRVMVHKDHSQTEFDSEVRASPPPQQATVHPIPLRLVI